MSWAALADRVNVAARDVFAEAVTYTPAGGSAVALNTPFDAAWEEVVIQDGVPVSAVAPMLSVRLADLPAAPRQGDTFTARGASYRVKVVKPDGHGWAKLTAQQTG
jgi:hypothetical protein